MLRIVIIFLLTSSNIFCEEWQVDKMNDNQVIFHSTTTLLDFEGTTEKVDGYLYWEGDSLFKDKNEIYFEVLPASFKTGIGKRDSDMREDVLETDKYPVSSFKGKVVETKKSEDNFVVRAQGEFSLHGISRPITIEARLTKSKERISVKCNFSVFLKDHKIDAPSLLAFVKVAQEIRIEVKLNLVRVK